MMRPAARGATYETLLALPEEVRAELVAGRIETAPSPLPEHNRAISELGYSLGGPFDRGHGRGGPGGWWIFSELDVRLSPHDVVRPDLSGWRRERLIEPWGKRPIDVLPDWICEVTSPSNVAHDRVVKANLYARCGVPYLWLVDPAGRTLEAFKLVEQMWMRFGSYDESATARIAPFEAVELEVGLLFPPRPAEAPGAG